MYKMESQHTFQREKENAPGNDTKSLQQNIQTTESDIPVTNPPLTITTTTTVTPNTTSPPLIHPPPIQTPDHTDIPHSSFVAHHSQGHKSESDTSGPKLSKESKSIGTSENGSGDSSVEALGGKATEGEGPSVVSDEIELIFMPHPTKMRQDTLLMKALKNNSIRYLKTTGNATVDHLSKYLATTWVLDFGKEIGITERSLNICIFLIPSPGQHIALNGSKTLRQVNDRFWKSSKPLEMFYLCKSA